MSREDDLLALADLVEKAEAGSRELDAEIWLATSPGATRKSTTAKSSKGLWPDYDVDETRDASGRLIIVPAFTSSLDAAMSLAGDLTVSVMLAALSRASSYFVEFNDKNNHIKNTLPRFVTAAALRARANNGSAT